MHVSLLPCWCLFIFHGRMTSPAVHLLPCPYTWLWFVALLKLCLFNSCKRNAKRGQCPSTHLLVSGLSRPQSRFCLIQTEAKLWGKCMDNFDDRQQQSFTPPTPFSIKGKGPWISCKCRWTFKRNECKSVEHSSKIRDLGVPVRQWPCLHGSKVKCYIYSQGYLTNQRTWPLQT